METVPAALEACIASRPARPAAPPPGGWLRRWLAPAEPPPPVTLEELRELALTLVLDCRAVEGERLRRRLRLARVPLELWLLRGEIYQCVARQHCQAEAAARINGLLPAFAGWVPGALRTAV